MEERQDAISLHLVFDGDTDSADRLIEVWASFVKDQCTLRFVWLLNDRKKPRSCLDEKSSGCVQQILINLNSSVDLNSISQL